MPSRCAFSTMLNLPVLATHPGRPFLAQRIEEQYLFIMETDHIILKPFRNTAMPTRPVAFGFYYMTHKYDSPKLYPAAAKYFDPDKIDPVGPSPLIIEKDCAPHSDSAIMKTDLAYMSVYQSYNSSLISS